MNASLWYTKDDTYAVCGGQGPLNVKGYIAIRKGGWVIVDNPGASVFMNAESAASSVLGQHLPEGLNYYEVARTDEARVILTYPDVIERLKGEGWSIKASVRSLKDLKQGRA